MLTSLKHQRQLQRLAGTDAFVDDYSFASIKQKAMTYLNRSSLNPNAVIFVVLCTSLVWLLYVFPMGGCFVALLGIFLVVHKGRERQRRVLKFERDYPAFLVALASAVKSGLDPISAISSTRMLFQEGSVIEGELNQFYKAIERGDSEEKAIQEFGDTIEHPDLPLFRLSFLLARKEGASLATCLRRLARVTRQRQSFRRKTKSAVAMQRLSAIGMVLCTCIIAVIQYSSNPDAMMSALAHEKGRTFLGLGSMLVVFGTIWILLLTRPRS